MLAPVPTPVVSDEELPPTADVVVVGGGVIGAFTALELAERGLKVILCERDQVASEQSGRNLGWVRITGRTPGEIDLMAAALERWEDLDDRVDAATGYVRCGVAYADPTTKEFDTRLAWSEHSFAKAFAPERVASLATLFPGSAFPSPNGALLGRLDGRAEPQLVAPAVVEAARRRGAGIYTNCAVRGFDVDRGCLSRVFTSRGIVSTRSLVVAGGHWSTLLLRRYGISFPQLKVLATVMSTKPLEGPETSFGTGRFGFRRRLDGGYNVGSFRTRFDVGPDAFRYGTKYLKAAASQKMRYSASRTFARDLIRGARWGMDTTSPFEERGHSETLPWFDQGQLLSQVSDFFPFLRKAELSKAWVGALDVTPDAVPVIDAVGDVTGLYLASGFSGHGFGLSPGAGLLMAQLVTGEPTCVNATPFSMSRL